MLSAVRRAVYFSPSADAATARQRLVSVVRGAGVRQLWPEGGTKRLGRRGRLSLRLPLAGQKISDLAGGHRRQPLENIGEVFLRIDAVAAAALNDGIDDGTAPPGIRVPEKEPSAFVTRPLR